MEEHQKTRPDFLIKQKGSDGKSITVGGAWKKTGQWGPFISLSIGQGETKQSYIMVAPPPQKTQQREPPKPPPVSSGNISTKSPFDDL
jgi:hypothetical protein